VEFRAAALLFDLDGVLVDSRAVVERTWRRWAARHRLDAEPLLAVAHGRRVSDTLKAVVPHLDPAPEVAWLDAAELEDLDGVVAAPGAAPLLGTLDRARWAIVTSCGRELAERRLARAGLSSPPVLVTSDDVPRGKPAPDGYLLGVRRCGAGAASCLVFEDAPPGVAAGQAAGCRVVALATTHTAAQLVAADVVAPDLRSVAVRFDGSQLVVTVR
jgi:sugar-phosphatase